MYYSDDPVKDAERYYASIEHEPKMVLPKCSYCLEPITDDECYEIEGERLCYNCMRINYAVEVRTLITYE